MPVGYNILKINTKQNLDTPFQCGCVSNMEISLKSI